MIRRVAAGAFALLFVFAAVVQINDPDPLMWIALYVAAAFVSARVALGHRAGRIGFAFGAAFLVVFALWAPALRHLSVDALQSFGMSGAAEEEEVREAIGLALVLLWTAVLCVTDPRRQSR